MSKIGKFKWFNEEKGFGVIESDDGQTFFAHSSDIKPKRPNSPIRDNQKVKFKDDKVETHLDLPRARQIEVV